jgi:putative cell wall-binding protein
MICAATGTDFPDALAGGVFAALYKAPLFLASGSLSQSQKDYLKAKNAGSITVFGGTGAVSDEAAKQIAEAKQAAE